MSPVSEVVARLAKLDTCVVSDAMDKLGVKGVAYGLRRLATSKKLAGRVRTVKLDEARGRTAPRHLCTAAVDGAEPGDVIVIEHRSRADCAGWGGILSAAAVKRRLAGVVIDGMCRDIDESEALGFPVYGGGAVPATARGRVIETDSNCRIEICGVDVGPGDFVLADGSGVVFLPETRVREILDTADRLAARELAMIEAVRSGAPVAEVMAGSYELMLEKDGE